jgi:hypothetical protein
LSSEASEPTPYIRREALCDAPASASECYLPILTGKEGFADVPPGTKFGGSAIATRPDEVGFVGASPDLRHVLLSSLEAGLTAGTSSGLYEWSAGAPAANALQPVSVLPASEGGGTVIGTVGGSPGKPWSGNRHSISDNGSRVFWMSNGGEGQGEGHSLYMYDAVKRETIRLDVQQPGVSSGGIPDAFFQIASSDGSKVFFTDIDRYQRLTAQSGAVGQDLYECEIVEEAGKSRCKLTDLTPESKGRDAVVQRSVLGASEDGSYVYFAAAGVLGDGAERGVVPGSCGWLEPEPSGTCNLYEYHDGAITFITALSNEDENAWDAQEYITSNVSKLTARVSPDGRYLAFMSSRSLTGYDNRDAAFSGKPDQEVYLYDAATKRLVCASCNPTGSRPVGVEVHEFTSAAGRPNLVAVRGGSGGAWGPESRVAANLPPWNELGGQGSSLYQPRYLSDSGRLFFNSNDALVSQDVNGQEDVYEFEPQGIGSCTSSNVTFSAKSGGCVSLISSGSSPEESGFLDASQSGGDVFFSTASRLTSQDYDTSYDVYDAHECIVSVSCVVSPVSPPPCDTGDSCRAAPALQPSVFGAPASATFAGAGNVAGSSSKPTVSGRSLTRAQKLGAALKACRKKPKRKRSACERQARERYRAKGARRAARVTRKVRG